MFLKHPERKGRQFLAAFLSFHGFVFSKKEGFMQLLIIINMVISFH